MKKFTIDEIKKFFQEERLTVADVEKALGEAMNEDFWEKMKERIGEEEPAKNAEIPGFLNF